MSLFIVKPLLVGTLNAIIPTYTQPEVRATPYRADIATVDNPDTTDSEIFDTDALNFPSLILPILVTVLLL